MAIRCLVTSRFYFVVEVARRGACAAAAVTSWDRLGRDTPPVPGTSVRALGQGGCAHLEGGARASAPALATISTLRIRSSPQEGPCASVGAYSRRAIVVFVFFWGAERKRGARCHTRPSPPPDPLFFIVFFPHPFSVRSRPRSTPRAVRPRPAPPPPPNIHRTAVHPPPPSTFSTSTADRETTAAIPAAMTPSPNHQPQPPPAPHHTAAHHTAAHHAIRSMDGASQTAGQAQNGEVALDPQVVQGLRPPGPHA